MRYVVVASSVLLLAVIVGGQERPLAQDVDSFAEARAADVFDDEPAESSIESAFDPAARPLSDGQAATLRQGIDKTREGYDALSEAARLFREGGNGEASKRMTAALETVESVGNSVIGDLSRRETALAQGIQKLEAEMARLEAELARMKEELRRNRAGKPEDGKPEQGITDPDFN